MGVVPSAWTKLFGGVAAQGAQFEESPISRSDTYYAFLSKSDADEDTGLYDVLFEVVSKEWFDNAVLSRPVSIDGAMPDSPALLYHLRGVDSATLLKTLGLKSTDDVAEGSWYLLKLLPPKGLGDDGPVVGDLYDPDVDSARS